MLVHVVYWVGLFAISRLFVLVEIQIEGPEGWAGRLPTWQIRNRWTRLLYSLGPLTGYHLHTQLFLLA